MICLDQPNRRMRTRMSGGVGGLPPRGGALSRYVLLSKYVLNALL